jgi:hypothetical protein
MNRITNARPKSSHISIWIHAVIACISIVRATYRMDGHGIKRYGIPIGPTYCGNTAGWFDLQTSLSQRLQRIGFGQRGRRPPTSARTESRWVSASLSFRVGILESETVSLFQGSFGGRSGGVEGETIFTPQLHDVRKAQIFSQPLFRPDFLPLAGSSPGGPTNFNGVKNLAADVLGGSLSVRLMLLRALSPLSEPPAGIPFLRRSSLPPCGAHFRT